MKNKAPLKILRKQLNRRRLRRSVRRITGFSAVFQDILKTEFRGEKGWLASDLTTMMFVPEDKYPNLARGESFPMFSIPPKSPEYTFVEPVDVFTLGIEVDEAEAITGAGTFDFRGSRYSSSALYQISRDFAEQGEVDADLWVRPESASGPDHLLFYGKKYGIVFGIAPFAKTTNPNLRNQLNLQ